MCGTTRVSKCLVGQWLGLEESQVGGGRGRAGAAGAGASEKKLAMDLTLVVKYSIILRRA